MNYSDVCHKVASEKQRELTQMSAIRPALNGLPAS